MISPNTPPGTEVVFKPISEDWDRGTNEPGLRPCFVYHVGRIVPCCGASSCVLFLVETARFHRWRRVDGLKRRWGFPLEDFELAVLPRCLSDLQTETKIRELV